MRKRKKKIALYYPWVYLKGGAERLIISIVSNSRYDWTIFTNHYDRGNTFPEFERLDVVEFSRVSVNRKYLKVGAASLKVMTQKVDLSDFDLLVIMNEGIGNFFTLRNHSLPSICLCLTPLKVIHDPYTRERYLKNNKGVFLIYMISSILFKIIDKIAWKYYVKVICISEEVKRRVLRAKLVPEEKIEVIYPGVDFKQIKYIAKYHKYFLIPGRIMWQKNIELGIEAFKKFIKLNEHSGFKLIIAGMVDIKSKQYLAKLINLSKGNKNIQFVENPNDSQLFDLYKKCYGVIFTSLNEDWGIVPLEAMAFGKPVISVDRGGPKESIIDGKTGFLVEPTADKMVEKMLLLAKDEGLTIKMGNAGKEHVGRFDSSNFINDLKKVIESITNK